MDSFERFLNSSLWLQKLSAEHARRARESIVEKEFRAGATICHKGRPADAWCGVAEGLVKLSSVAPSGKMVTFAGIPAGSWFGEGSVMKREIRRYDVIALRRSRIAFLPEASFNWLLDHSLAFSRFILIHINERLSQLMAAKEHAWLLTLEGRVASALGELFNPVLYPATAAGIEISQEELGFLAGVSRQRVNRALRAMESEGIVRVEYGRITILDRPRLRSFGS